MTLTPWDVACGNSICWKEKRSDSYTTSRERGWSVSWDKIIRSIHLIPLAPHKRPTKTFFLCRFSMQQNYTQQKNKTARHLAKDNNSFSKAPRHKCPTKCKNVLTLESVRNVEYGGSCAILQACSDTKSPDSLVLDSNDDSTHWYRGSRVSLWVLEDVVVAAVPTGTLILKIYFFDFFELYYNKSFLHQNSNRVDIEPDS